MKLRYTLRQVDGVALPVTSIARGTLVSIPAVQGNTGTPHTNVKTVLIGFRATGAMARSPLTSISRAHATTIQTMCRTVKVD